MRVPLSQELSVKTYLPLALSLTLAMDFLADTVSPFVLRALYCCPILIVLFAVTSIRTPKSTLIWVALDEDPTTKGVQNVSKARKQWVENCNAVIDKGLREVSCIPTEHPKLLYFLA